MGRTQRAHCGQLSEPFLAHRASAGAVGAAHAHVGPVTRDAGGDASHVHGQQMAREQQQVPHVQLA